MKGNVALIGFGEAGSTFAAAGRWSRSARVFDVLAERRAFAADCGVRACDSPAEALDGASLALSLVTADQALAAAEAGAATIARGALWCDMNSVSPATKRAAADAIGAAGGRYVDVAVMAPVNPARLDVPLLVAGPAADEARAALGGLGFASVRAVGEEIGRASTIKMLRSVMYKGLEALTAECLVACERAGVTGEVLASFGNDWASGADYRLDRMLEHGTRRAAEMRESARTLRDLGVEPRLTDGTAAWQETFGALAVDVVPQGLTAKLDLLKERLA